MQRKGNHQPPLQGGDTMKYTTALALFVATLITMGSAHLRAQAIETKIPFNFNVGDEAFPAGAYLVSYHSSDHLAIRLRSQDGRLVVFSTVAHVDGSPSGAAKLVFTNYGNRYFLHEVLCNAANMNVKLPESGLEKRVSIHEAHSERGETSIAALVVGAN
jgi:hypothetical protein